MDNFDKLIQRSYEAIRKRGLITDSTTLDEFNKKMREELYEVEHEQFCVENGQGHRLDNYVSECIDLANVCFMQVKKLGFDPVKEFEKCVIHQETRKD